MLRKTVVASALLMAVAIAVAGAAPAENVLHLKLDKSMPEADQVLASSPDKIVLEFSEEPELAVARVSVTAGHGDATLSKVARSEEDATILWVAVEEPLVDGTYTVTWVTSSADGHPVRGDFAFTVKADR